MNKDKKKAIKDCRKALDKLKDANDACYRSIFEVRESFGVAKTMFFEPLPPIELGLIKLQEKLDELEKLSI